MGQWCTALLLATLLAATSGAPPARAQGPERLKIVGNDRQLVHPDPPGALHHHPDPDCLCASQGFPATLDSPARGTPKWAEIEVLQALNDPQTMVIDMRDDGEPLEAAIPNSSNIPFNELEDRMDEMGCTRQNKQPWDCTKALQIVALLQRPGLSAKPCRHCQHGARRLSGEQNFLLPRRHDGLGSPGADHHPSGHRPTKK